MIGSAALQRAVYDALTAALSVPVYDEVPAASVAPYVAFGPSYGESWDTHDADGQEESFQLDVWSRAAGWREVKGLMEEIHAALHGVTLPLTVGQLALLQYDFSTTLRDESQAGVVWRHGVMRFRALITS